MKFSLLVVTTDRLRLVERLFVSLAAQTYKNFELILIHGKGCAVEAQTLVGNYAAKLNIKIVTSTDNCLSRSRNIALSLINGDIVSFPDDDCMYAPNTLAQCASAFAETPCAHVLMARVLDMDATILPSTAAVREINRVSVFRHSISFAQFLKKECVKAVGGFDEDLGVGCATPFQSGEDTDYVLRALKAGFRLFYAPSIVVRHPAVNLRDPVLPGKVQAYARGRMRLLQKHGMPTWFIMANIVHPLARIPVECLKEGLLICRYRWGMFKARLAGRL